MPSSLEKAKVVQVIDFYQRVGILIALAANDNREDLHVDKARGGRRKSIRWTS